MLNVILASITYLPYQTVQEMEPLRSQTELKNCYLHPFKARIRVNLPFKGTLCSLGEDILIKDLP